MIVSTDDKEFQGEMIDAGINAVTIDDIDGGYTIVPRKDIQAVEIDVQGGDKLKGAFHNWRDGVWVLQVGDRLVDVQDGPTPPPNHPTAYRDNIEWGTYCEWLGGGEGWCRLSANHALPKQRGLVLFALSRAT